MGTNLSSCFFSIANTSYSFFGCTAKFSFSQYPILPISDLEAWIGKWVAYWNTNCYFFSIMVVWKMGSLLIFLSLSDKYHFYHKFDSRALWFIISRFREAIHAIDSLFLLIIPKFAWICCSELHWSFVNTDLLSFWCFLLAKLGHVLLQIQDASQQTQNLHLLLLRG